MKKLLLILAFLFPVFIQAQDIVIDERITDIYHANGIMTTKREAYVSLDLIIKATKKDIYSNNETLMKKETHFDLLYNETYNMFWDKLETFKQKKMDDRWFWVMVDTAYSGGCGYITGGAANALRSMIEGLVIEIIADPVQNWLEVTFIKNLVELLLGFYELDICAIIPSAIGLASDVMHDRDFTQHMKDIRGSVISGHHALVIAHGQGNLFFNEAYKALNSNDEKWMREYINTIAIASPSENILEKSTAVSFDNDPIAEISDNTSGVVENPLRYVRIIVKPEDENKYDGQTLPCANGVYFKDDVMLDACLKQYNFDANYDVKNLKFNMFEYYMSPVFSVDNGIQVIEKPNPAYDKIITALKSYIQSYKYSFSQWKVKKKQFLRRFGNLRE